MARFKRIEVLHKISEQGMIPVFYSPDANLMKNIIRACYDGGCRLFEYTNRGDFAHEVFTELNKWAEKELPDLIMGIGSVMDSGTASLYLQSGANFVVSPVLKEDMAKICNRRKVAWIPGCGSATEISFAEELGAEIVKIFPGTSVGGPKFVSALLGPSPWSHIMPTGDVEPSEQNLNGWFGSGVFCVGMGAKLISAEIVSQGNFVLLSEKCKASLDIINILKKK